jgi:hypothetical protein
MTSKFAPLTKLKKEQLEEVRRLLLQSNLYIQNLETELVGFEQDLMNQKAPTSGTIALFSQYTALTQACHDQIIRKKDQIYYAKQERYKIQDQVKVALLEFEKFNYLQIEEEKEHARKIKKEEAIQLDEVAIMGYNAKKTS